MSIYQVARVLLESAIVLMLGWTILFYNPVVGEHEYIQTIVQVGADTECIFMSNGVGVLPGPCGPLGTIDTGHATRQE